MKHGRSILRNFEPYVPGEQPKREGVVKLNTNENPYPPSPNVLAAVRSLTDSKLRTYPDPLALTLREKCAERYGFDGPEWVMAGNGMDELLAMTVRTFVDPGDSTLTVYPSYTFYDTLAALHGARMEYAHLDDRFELTDELFGARARLCFFPRPNAPTGIAHPRSEVERFCASFDGLVLVDEAYVDFADDNCLDFPKRFDNVIVTRTFSKSFSLAGVRVGVAMARPEIIQELLKTKESYNLNAMSQAAAVAALDDYEYMEGNVARIRATRDRLQMRLERLGFTVPASQANFVFARWTGRPSAKEIFVALRARDILVRYFEIPRLEDGLRISIGTDAECDALVNALADILETTA